jgi:CHAT domain-containing protein/tetratricopeptide (TPR) repeat protein
MHLKTACQMTKKYLGLILASQFAAGTPDAALETPKFALRPGQARAHEISATEGDYVRIVINGERIDIGARAWPPDGRLVAESIHTHALRETESLEFLAPASGRHRFEVRDLRKNGRTGGYSYYVDNRPATEEDRDGIRARQLVREADRLFHRGASGDLAAAQHRVEEAVELWRGIKKRKKQPDLRIQFQAAYLLSEIEKHQGRHEDALRHRAEAESWRIQFSSACRGAFALADRCPASIDRLVRRKAISALDEIQRLSGLYSSIIEHEETPSEAAANARLLNSRGGLLAELGETDQALESYREALECATRSEDARIRASVLHNLGLLYLDLGAYERSLSSLDEALSVWKRVREPESEAATLSQIGRAQLALDRPRLALRLEGSALALAREVRDPVVEGNSHCVAAEAYVRLDQNRLALEYYDRARRMKSEIGDRLGEAVAEMGYGAACEILERPDNARVAFERALALARREEIPAAEAAALFGLARVERRNGSAEKARERIEGAIAILENLRDRISARELRASFFASLRAYFEFYIDLLMEGDDNERSAERSRAAFEQSERARARCLLEALSESRFRIRLDAPPELLERLSVARARLRRNTETRRLLSGELFVSDRKEQDAALAGEAERIRAEQREIEDALRQVSPRYAELMDARHLTLREIQSQVLDPETILLQYSLGDRRSYLWIVTPTAIRNVVLPGRSRIGAAARRFYVALTARNETPASESASARIRRWTRADAECPRSATELSRMILGPVYDQLRNKRLLIIADGVLQYVPFAALPAPDTADGQDRNAPLILRHEIVSAPSASTIGIIRRDAAARAAAPGTIAVLADPVFDAKDSRVTGYADSSPVRAFKDARNNALLLRSLRETGGSAAASTFPRLIFTRDEAREIARLVPDQDRLDALDFEASRATALGGEVGRYRMIHLATHALVNSRDPALSGIVLSLVDSAGRPQDGFLRLHEIFDMRLSAEIVTLSACRTALGREVYGEGLIGLTRGFIEAGTPRVLASLWKVDDMATFELMKRFYGAMLGGRGLRPAAALREAQIELYASERWWRPYYWAAFTLHGEWR